MTDTDNRGSTPIERRIGLAIQSLILAVVCGMVSIVWFASIDVEVFKETITNMKEGISDIKQAAQDRYTGTEARRNLGRIERYVNDHETSLRKLEAW